MSDRYKTLSKRLSHLVANSLESDFTFHVTEDDHQAVPAHKIIIAAGSPVLHRIVYGHELAQSSGTSATVTEISAENFIELLRFLYTDTANISETNAMEILFKANYYEITELENICARVLIHSISVQNVWPIYQQVCHFQIYDRLLPQSCLRQWCARTIAFCSKMAFENEDFLELSLDELRLILEMPALNIDNVELFKSLLIWARHECVRKELPETPANLRQVLEGVEQMIGFESMAMEEFRRCRHLCEGFFNDDDIVNVQQGGETRRAMSLFKDAVWIARENGNQLPPSAVFIKFRSSYIGRHYSNGSYHYLEVYTQHNQLSYEVLCGSGYEWTEVNALATDTITNAVALSNSDDHPLVIIRSEGDTNQNDEPTRVHTLDFTKYREDDDVPEDTDHPVKSQRFFQFNTVYYLNGKHAKPPLEPGVIPVDAVIGGSLRDGTPLYVCRAVHNGDMLPGHYIPTEGLAYVSYGMHSHAKTEYELVRHPNPMWVPSRMGAVPLHAAHGGHTELGEELFICRCRHSEGNWIPGKVHKSHRTAYIAYDGIELAFSDYEVLVDRHSVD